MKNLKMFAFAVMAFAVMATGVHAATCTLATDKVVARYNGTDYCAADVTAAITAANTAEAKELTVTFLDDVSESGAITLASTTVEKLTIKLDGHDWKLATNDITVGEGKTVELQGTGDVSSSANYMVNLGVKGTFKTSGTLTVSAAGFVEVTGSSDGSKVATLEIGKDTNVTTTAIGVNMKDANNIKATIDGTWTATSNVVAVADGANVAGKIANITINGTLTSDAAAISLAGYANVTLNAKVTGGDDASDGGAISVAATSAPTITITGGKYVAKAGSTNDAAAIIIADDSQDTTLKISCGEFTASKSTIAAISFGSDEAVEHNKGNITGGTFQYGLTDKTSKLTVEEAIKLLTGTESYTIGEDKTVTLACGTQNPSGEPSDEQGQPGTTEPGETGDGNQGPTDNVKNPETNDNILVYAGLGLVSLTSVAFTARKRED